jgi:hypothetical protein
METILVLSEKEQKKLSQLKKEIRDRERNFKKMTKAQKRVAIAKDVLGQLRQGTIEAESGSWCPILDDIRFDRTVNKQVNKTIDTDGQYVYGDMEKVTRKVKKALANVEVRSMILEGMAAQQENCSACALGALFTCAVLRKDELSVADVQKRVNNGNEFKVIKDYLGEFFSERQLDLLEFCFEQGSGAAGSHNDDDEFLAAAEYGMDYHSDEGRLTAMMKNIVKNSGKFVVPKKYFE